MLSCYSFKSNPIIFFDHTLNAFCLSLSLPFFIFFFLFMLILLMLDCREYRERESERVRETKHQNFPFKLLNSRTATFIFFLLSLSHSLTHLFILFCNISARFSWKMLSIFYSVYHASKSLLYVLASFSPFIRLLLTHSLSLARFILHFFHFTN
jgi:hypothetical protein